MNICSLIFFIFVMKLNWYAKQKKVSKDNDASAYGRF